MKLNVTCHCSGHLNVYPFKGYFCRTTGIYLTEQQIKTINSDFIGLPLYKDEFVDYKQKLYLPEKYKIFI